MDVADSVPTVTSTPKKDLIPDGDKGLGDDTENPEIAAMVEQSRQRLAAWPMLFDGNRAVLALEKRTGFDAEQSGFVGNRFGGAPLYEVVRGSGLYLLADGKVRSERSKTPVAEPDRGLDGKTENEVMDAAKTYAEDGRVSYASSESGGASSR